MVGRRVQQYQFTEKLGAGGMGEIYKAQDTRLTRTVAIKVLPSAKSGDPDRRRLFLLEAQAASGLNHPSIITIHDIVSEGDTEFMVMEYVQGKTLNDIIPKGGLRVPQVIKYALQMADALSAAHSAGIVHRDLKPANVMVTESGLVKILDFGLAKMTDQPPVPEDDKTRTIANAAPLTVEGSILGTVSYMSPEQAQGKKVDARSDIFSYGAVLYEMATGQRAFEGESSLSTLSAILRDDPKPMAEVAPDVPPSLEGVFCRCLRKNPDDRWQGMKEVQAALSALKRESDSGSLYTTRMMAPPNVSQVAAPGAVAPSAVVGNAAPPAAASSKASSMIAVAAVFVVLVGGGGAVWRTMKQHTAERAAAELAAKQTPAAPEPAPAAPPLPPDTTLTNDNVAEMVTAKVPTDLNPEPDPFGGRNRLRFVHRGDHPADQGRRVASDHRADAQSQARSGRRAADTAGVQYAECEAACAGSHSGDGHGADANTRSGADHHFVERRSLHAGAGPGARVHTDGRRHSQPVRQRRRAGCDPV